MANRKQMKRRLRENPQFHKWLKGKPELYNQIKRDPAGLEGMIVSWKREQTKLAQLQKIGQGYRQVVSQIQELNTLVERVDSLMSNIKIMNERWSEYKNQYIATEKAAEVSTKERKRKTRVN